MNAINSTSYIFHMWEYSWYSQAHTKMCAHFSHRTNDEMFTVNNPENLGVTLSSNPECYFL